MAAKGKQPGRKKGQKRGKARAAPPVQDKGWEKAIINGKWERPLESLPDPAAHQSFADLREKMLSTLEQFSIHWSESVAMNDFVQELFSARREKLMGLEFRGSRFLTRIVLSPSTIAPNLKVLDMSCCEALEYVFLQSMAMEILSLHRCASLKKAILHTKQLREVNLLECRKLSILLLWSDVLSKLELHSLELSTCQLHCPNLQCLDKLEP